MDDQEFRKLLEQLHGEIENTDTVDDKGQALLRDLGSDIRSLLERSETGEAAQPQEAALRNMEDTIVHFEVTHPNLSAALAKLLAILGNAGI